MLHKYRGFICKELQDSSVDLLSELFTVFWKCKDYLKYSGVGCVPSTVNTRHAANMEQDCALLSALFPSQVVGILFILLHVSSPVL